MAPTTTALIIVAAVALSWWARRRRRSIITPTQWTQFDRDGYIVLRPDQVFASPHDDLLSLQQRMDDIMLGTCAEPPPYERMMMQLDSCTGVYADAGEQTLGYKGKTLRYRKIQNLDLDDLVMGLFLRRPCFAEACERVYGKGTPISSFRTMFFNKPCAPSAASSGGTHLPWHQDRWRFLDIDPLLNAYLALDPASPESGCVRLLPRSHTLGILNPSHHSAFLTEGQIECYCGAKAEASGAIVDLVLQPGEVALIHNWVVHSSGTNRTARARRALSVSYMDARTKLNEAEFGRFTGGELKSSGYPEGGTHFPQIF